jgi:hypothetical protein
MKASAIRVVGLTVVVGLSIVLLAYHLWSTDGLFVVPAFGGGPQSAIAPSRPRCVATVASTAGASNFALRRRQADIS